MDHIKQRAFMGFLWRGGYQVLHQVASLVVKIILVRLLVPEDFGLVAMAMIVFMAVDIFNKFATGEPFIRDLDSDPERAKNTLFYLNVLFIGFAATTGVLSAPYVTDFFSKRISNPASLTTLTWVIRIFSLRLLFSIFGSVPMAVLKKELKFRQLYLSNMAGTLAYLISAPILAFSGFGLWSIVVGHVIEQIVITIVVFRCSPFVPILVFSKKIARKYISYNSNIFINSIIFVIISQGDDTIIGRMLGPVILGFYNIGQQFAMLSVTIISSNVTDVVFPVFSRVQNDKELFTKIFFKSFRLIALFSFPIIGGSAVLADEIVRYFFGDQWLPMIPVFYVLCIANLLTVLISLAAPIFGCLNRLHLIRNSQLMELVVFLATIYPLTVKWGAVGVCWVMLLLPVVRISYLSSKLNALFDKFIRVVFATLVRVSFSTLAMMASVYLLKQVFSLGIPLFVICIGTGVSIYFFIMFLCDKLFVEDVRDVFQLLTKKLSPA